MNPNRLDFHPLFDAPELLYQAMDNGTINYDEFLDYLVNRDDFEVIRIGNTYVAKRLLPQLEELEEKNLESGDFSKVSTKPVDINNIISDVEEALEENIG